MKPARIFRGDTWERVWNIKDANRTPIDLTGVAATVTVLDSSGAAVLSATGANGRITITPAQGRIALLVSHTDMAALPAGEYRFHMKVMYPVSAAYPDGRLVTYEANRLTISPDNGAA